VKKDLVCPHCGKPVERYRNPIPTVDIIIEMEGGVVLVQRKNPPLGWALPGGFVDYGESLEEAAIRAGGKASCERGTTPGMSVFSVRKTSPAISHSITEGS